MFIYNNLFLFELCKHEENQVIFGSFEKYDLKNIHMASNT